MDVHLADGMAVMNLTGDRLQVIDSASLYLAVFSKHKVTRERFDSTLRYYSGRPADFQRLYTKVNARLKLLEASLNESLAAEDSARVSVVWEDLRARSFPQEAMNSRVPIDVPVSGKGTYTVTATIKVYPEDRTVMPRMSLYFYYNDSTPEGRRDWFNVANLRNDGQVRDYSVSKELTSDRAARIRGYIVNRSNADSMFQMHLVISRIRVVRKQ